MAHALVRAASRLVSTPVLDVSKSPEQLTGQQTGHCVAAVPGLIRAWAGLTRQ